MVQHVPQPSKMFPKHRLRCLRVFSALFHSPVSSDMDLKEEVAVLRSMEEELQKEYKHQKVKAETLQKDLENVKEKLEPNPSHPRRLKMW